MRSKKSEATRKHFFTASERVLMFEPETKRAASVVQIVFGRTEAGRLPSLESGRRRDARGGKRFGPEVNMNTLSE
jgi:hypothetical protein